MDQQFHSTSYGNLDTKEVVSAIQNFINENPKVLYTLVIGSDSHDKEDEKGKRHLNLVTAVVVYRHGFGGRYFWKRKTVYNIHTLRDKIYAETLESLEFAKSFVPFLQQSLNGKASEYKLEIHVDIGEYGDTREMIKEVVGMVTGYGFVARTKPYSFGASYVADKHT